MAQAEELQQDPIAQRLRALDPHCVAEVTEFRGERTLVVPRAHLLLAARTLRDDPELRFNFLSDICAVDRYPTEPRFELNYHLLSIPRKAVVRIRVRVHAAEPSVHSVIPVWSTANWLEREIFDLFGLQFEGHPDLRRLVLPDDWDGYPLRKDYLTTGPR
jgi:NADH-quinone oxidoreductase subunit C